MWAQCNLVLHIQYAADQKLPDDVISGLEEIISVSTSTFDKTFKKFVSGSEFMPSVELAGHNLTLELRQTAADRAKFLY